MYRIYEKFKSISEQFKSIYEKCHNSARVSIPATTLYNKSILKFKCLFELRPKTDNNLVNLQVLEKNNIQQNFANTAIFTKTTMAKNMSIYDLSNDIQTTESNRYKKTKNLNNIEY